MTRLILAAISLFLLAGLLLWLGTRPGYPVAASAQAAEELVVLCAAGVRKPTEACAAAFTRETGIAVRFQFGGSGQLLASLGGGVPADLFVAGDASFVRLGRDKHLLREAIPLATQSAVLAVARGNPRHIAGLADLLQPGIRLGLPNPEAASLGKAARRELTAQGRWEALVAAMVVMKPTVPDLAIDLTTGALDAALLWDANARQGGFHIVPVPELAAAREAVTVALTTTCVRPQAALRFARWLASPEQGNPAWRAEGYAPLPGDAWAPRPQLSLYSGTVNRLGIQTSLIEFADREGVELAVVYNGCGVLCASMKLLAQEGGALPDAYYACDICFVAPVAERFPEAVILTEADIVIAVPAGNPRRIRTLADLAQPGLRVGLGNAMQSTLGYMTDRMLAASGLRQAVLANAVSQVPAGDLLVTQLRAGSLDAAIVYSTNAKPQAGSIDTIPLAMAGAKALQPFAVATGSPRAQLAQRLLDHLRANRSRFESAGFRWRGDGSALPSASFPSDPADAQRP